jgi:origin recognition complex subunit 1
VKGWQYIQTGVYWCARAFDKGAKGGKVFGVDIDEWREGGKAGLGWNIKLTTAVVEEENQNEESSDGEATGSEASEGEEGSETDSEGEDELQGEGETEGDRLRAGEGRLKSGRKRRRRSEGLRRSKGSKRAKSAKTVTKRQVVRGKTKRLPHPKSSSSFLPLSVQSLEDLPTNPYERALRLLHVGATPESLPCREEEFVDVLSRVEEGVETGGGGCLCMFTVDCSLESQNAGAYFQISPVSLEQARPRPSTRW